jgi:conjugative transfer signal peptidase TraF
MRLRESLEGLVQLADRLRRSRWRWVLLACSLAAMSVAAVSPWYELVWRTRASWPTHRLFLLRKGVPPTRGALVVFRLTPELVARVRPPRERPYAQPGDRWLKRVMGVPGDTIAVQPLPDGRAVIWLNGQRIGIALAQDRDGWPIQAAQLASPIPPGQYYVQLEHPRSFDSRYFGYVPETLIEGVAIPLW